MKTPKIKISIIIPAYNEQNTLESVVKKTNSIDIKNKEIIVVNDGSTDGTKKIIEKKLKPKYPKIKFVHHPTNKGKGAAILSGIKAAKGMYVAIQDADEENRPEIIKELVDKADKTSGKVLVIGSRFSIQKNSFIYLHYYYGQILLSKIIKILFKQKIADPYNGHKLFKKNDINFSLEEKGFGIEAELVANALKNHFKIVEVPEPYTPRKFEQGKKIRSSDGLKAFLIIIKIFFKTNTKQKNLTE